MGLNSFFVGTVVWFGFLLYGMLELYYNLMVIVLRFYMLDEKLLNSSES